MIVPSDEQQAIVSAVRDFAAARLAPHAVEWDQQKHFPVDVLRQAGELGLGGIHAREDVGGAGLRRSDSIVIFEELAKGDTAIAAYISIHNMVVGMIDAFGSDEQRHRWIPKLASMEHLGSYCLTEPDAGSDAAAITTSAVRDGDTYVINGTKKFTSGAGASSVYVVMARTGGPGPQGISAIVVPAEAENLSFGPPDIKMGWKAQPTRQVIFRDVRVPVANRLGDEGSGFSIAMTGLHGGRLNLGACSIGGAQWALDRAVAYIRHRQAFGKPLSEQQALVFAVADMETELQAARCLLRHAAWALDTAQADLASLCAMAKRFATDVGFSVANSALQLHGGNGYLTEYGVEKVVRDLRVHQIAEGTNEIMRLIVGRAVVEKSA
ncbi:acyl-CoA dehydrogenase family protein [Mycetocola sp. 2940]|uniref:acyl-CoA dehydrogenase family protein n=1 Tax=Mycetocola sp. 2940 TaxID=3156452 RepID=UPI0033964D71